MESIFNLAVVLSAIDRASGPIRQVRQSLGTLAEQAETVRRVGEQMTIAGALTQGAANQMTGALGAVVQPAIAFESAMADVRKVVDFQAPGQFARMGADIRRLSTEIPLAAEGIAEIVAAAGQSGIARGNLLGFAEDAATMAVAFDMTAGRAGQAMAAIRAGLNLTQPEVVRLGDATNFLSNNMNALASDITEVIARQGSTAKAAGLAAEQTAALSAALLSSGKSPEIAATALKNLTGALTAGEAATGRQAEALETLGFSAENMARFMQDDAQGAIMAVFRALAEQPAEARGSIASLLFGEESKGAILPLLTNLGNLERAFALVGDRTRFAGSMSAEYEARSQTTANALQLFNNQLADLRVTLGSFVLPAMNDMLPLLQGLVERIKAFAEAHPLLFKVALGFAGLLAAVLAVVAPILTVTGGLTLMGAHGLKGLSLLMTGFRRLLPSVANAGRLTWIFGSRVAGVLKAAPRFIAATARMAAALAGRLVPSLWAGAVGFARLSLTALRFAGRAAAGVVGAAGRLAVSLTASLVPALGGAIASAWAFTAALLANPITWIVAAIVGAALLIRRFWGPISDLFERVFGRISEAFDRGFVQGVMEVLKAFSPLAWIAPALDAVVGYLFGIDLAAAGRALMASLAAGLRALAGDPLGAVTAAIGRVRQWLSAIDLAASGRALLNTLVAGIRSVASAPMAAVRRALQWVRDLLPFSDARRGPLSDLTLSGRRLVETLAGGIAAVAGAPARIAAGIAGRIMGAFDLDLGARAGAAVRAAASAVARLADDPVGAATRLAARIAGAFDLDLAASGRALVRTLVEGIRSVASAPMAAVESALQGVRELLPFSDARRGPLSELTLSGQRLAETLGQGVAAAGAAPIARPLAAAFAAALSAAAAVPPPSLAAPAVAAPAVPEALQRVRQQIETPAPPPLPDLVQRIRQVVEPPPALAAPAVPEALQRVRQQVEAPAPPPLPDLVQRIRQVVEPAPGVRALDRALAPAIPAATTAASLPAPRVAPLPRPAAGRAGTPVDAGQAPPPVQVTVNLTVEGGAAEGGDLAERLDALLRARGRDIAELVAEQTRRRRRREVEDDR